MSGILRILMAAIAIFTALVLVILVLIVETKPVVVSAATQQVNQAESVNKLLSQIKSSLRRRYSYQNIPVSEDQLNSLVGLGQRAIPAFNGQFTVSPNSTQLAMSYKLVSSPFTGYINLNLKVLPGQYLNIESVSAGGLSLPGDIVMRTLVWTIDWWTDSEIASHFVRQVERVVMFEDSLILTLRPLDELLKELNSVKNGISSEQDEKLRLATAHYLRFLSNVKASQQAPSLSEFMRPLFAEAQTRSVDGVAAEENKAAIMALAIFAGHHRFANFVGDVQPTAGRAVIPVSAPVLAKRKDLSQHFIFSAAIKILSQEGISSAIGEFKELMDRGEGGSGFSFVDLAADLAGVEFAERATHSATAAHIQKVVADSLDESAFFPRIDGLPEGLSKARFEQDFTEVDSEKYLALRGTIEARLAELPAYK